MTDELTLIGSLQTRVFSCDGAVQLSTVLGSRLGLDSVLLLSKVTISLTALAGTWVSLPSSNLQHISSDYPSL